MLTLPFLMMLTLPCEYGVGTKRINEAMCKNAQKFPSDCMFALRKERIETLW